jgi:predicted AAA+ superfamily ATPase
MYYPRIAEKIIKQYLKIFPVVGVMGPRQSGKSTMLRRLLGKEYTYLTFDDFELKELFYNDPKKFVSR